VPFDNLAANFFKALGEKPTGDLQEDKKYLWYDGLCLSVDVRSPLTVRVCV